MMTAPVQDFFIYGCEVRQDHPSVGPEPDTQFNRHHQKQGHTVFLRPSLHPHHHDVPVLLHQPEPPRLLGGVGVDVGVEPVHPGRRRPVPFSPGGRRCQAKPDG